MANLKKFFRKQKEKDMWVCIHRTCQYKNSGGESCLECGWLRPVCAIPACGCTGYAHP